MRAEDIIEPSQIVALGKAGFVVVPKNCVAPQLLGKAVKIDAGVPRADAVLTAIRQAAAERANLSVRDLIGPALQRRFSVPRQIAMFVAVEYFNRSVTLVAAALARSDHSTIRSGVARIKSELRHPVHAEAMVEKLEWVKARAEDLISGAQK